MGVAATVLNLLDQTQTYILTHAVLIGQCNKDWAKAVSLPG